MKISIIVAIGENNEIGKDNDLLWHLGDDLKRFKKLTSNGVVIMGQKTYESLPFKPLPKRVNIVITDDPDVIFDGCVMANGIDDAIIKAEFWSAGGPDFIGNTEEVFVIGGGSIYKQFINRADTLYITKVHESFEADTFFPDISDWVTHFREDHKKDENNDYDYSYLIMEKRKFITIND